MTNTTLLRIGADIPVKTRQFLLRRFIPAFADVHCTALTYAFRVPSEYAFPKDDLDVTIYGYHRFEDEHEALLVRVSGLMFRPDGKRFFIALSCGRGEQPARCAEIDSDSISLLDTEIKLNNIRLRQFPLWNKKPQQNKKAA